MNPFERLIAVLEMEVEISKAFKGYVSDDARRRIEEALLAFIDSRVNVTESDRIREEWEKLQWLRS